jgi:hypothetical protein
MAKSFPPKSGGNSKPLKVVENATVTSGNGGIKASLAVKKAGTKDSPGKEKVNSAS